MTALLATMAFSFANADKPAADAVLVHELSPSGMENCREWDTASPVALAGFGGAPVQDTEVRVLWNKNWFFFTFDCSDHSVISPGSRDGLDHFRLGDTVEVFIARSGAKDYAEIHATPAGRKTAYFFCDYREAAGQPSAAGKIRVAATATPQGWRAFLAVPRDLFGCGADADEYEIFFGRYDYEAEGGKPVLSSYPAQRGDKPDFHRREDYAIMRLKS
jgi:hypothetical protein